MKCTVIKIKFTLQVRCTTDHGEFETQDGDIIVLKKNTQVRMIYVVGWFGPAESHQFDSLFSSEVVVSEPCLVTLLLTIMKH